MKKNSINVCRLAMGMLVFVSGIARLEAQDAPRGIVMPLNVTGGFLVSDRPKAAEPSADAAVAGFRAVMYPGLKLTPRWFVESTVQVQSKPFFYYEAFYPAKEIEVRALELLVGFNHVGESSSIGFKAGKLASAFGSFPLRYSDKVNPLLDQPLGYAYPVKLRPDQLPCGSGDLAHQQTYPVYVHHYCGGSLDEREGIVPVTLYGLTGAEIDANWRRLDGRFQVTNSSPANPQSLWSRNQHLQWTAGSGFTIQQGFRIGTSAFQGPFLEENVSALLPTGTNVRDYPATGIGVDLQWGRGRWSVNSEWQRVEFNYPQFSEPPAISTAYAELKAIVTPRFYTAIRSQYRNHHRVKDSIGTEVEHFNANRQSYEFAVGYHLNRSQDLKFGYEWLKTDGITGGRDNAIGLQFVTSVNLFSRAF